MSIKQYIGDNCTVLCENNNKSVDAEILDFKEHQMMSVSINRSLKLTLSWNGKIYEGRMSGMTFVSSGPKITEVKQGR
jgi:hypothetical protein